MRLQSNKGAAWLRLCRGRNVQKARAKVSIGFTIVELLIVVVIVAILSAITVVVYSGMQARADNAVTNQSVAQYAKALQAYKQLNDSYPSTAGGFVCITGAADICGNTSNTSAACFVLAQYRGTGSLDTSLASVISAQPTAGKGGACGGAIYAGIMYDYTGQRLIWFLSGSQTCPSLGGMNNTNTSSSAGVTRCFAYLP